MLSKISPSAHSAFYDVERFLALMACQREKMEKNSSPQQVFAKAGLDNVTSVWQASVAIRARLNFIFSS